MLCFSQRFLTFIVLTGTLLLFLSTQAQAFCFEEAGLRYKIDPLLLRSVAIVESRLNPQAVGKNRDKQGRITSRDYGLMQINEIHIPGLRTLGIIRDKQDLLNNSCLNVQIGAWVLAKHLKKCGVSWECLGSYNAGFATNNSSNRMIYARKVYSTYLKLTGGAT
ncbi:lytic transglycosylase domain-containing protein (plasmid) [Xenorhabdus stockiae]|uniref:lytic transglycosylase domain-containing protein n=1 Tax=Xenorhabdus stockiae TaxID=351614 RepID=UPI003CF51168